MEKLVPIRFLPEGAEYPKWVDNVERQLGPVLLPAAKLKDANPAITPKRMGAVIGHACGMAVWLLELFGSRNQKALTGAVMPLTGDALKNAEELKGAFLTWYDAACRLAKLSLASSVDQSYEDMRDFLVGYADGFSRKPKTLNVAGIGNPNTEIYVFLLMYWRLMERIKSVRKLHELLIKVFGANRIGEQKRIEKICERSGLNFRKPGRPRKE